MRFEEGGDGDIEVSLGAKLLNAELVLGCRELFLLKLDDGFQVWDGVLGHG